MVTDLRYAWRTLGHNPGFALAAILSIGLGIGANATVFSLADGLLLRPLPVPDAAGVLTLQSRTPSGTFAPVSYPDYLAFRSKLRSFDGLIAYELTTFGYALDARSEAKLDVGLLVSANFFPVLGVEPRLGRGFRADDDQVPGRDAVAVVGYDFWRSQLGSDRDVIGRRLRLNGVDFTVIGVAPKSFTGMDQYFQPAFFVPIAMAPRLVASNRNLLTDRAARVFDVEGRLRPGVSMGAAGAEAAALAGSLAKAYPATNQAVGTAVRTELEKRMSISVGDTALVGFLSSLVLVALLIACANVANLMLNRGRARAREIAVRLAIGASRARLVRQLMAESLLIGLAGGGAGLLLASFGVGMLATVQIPSTLPFHLTFTIDARVLWFTLAASILCTLVFGLAPALQSTKSDLVPALKAGELDRRRGRLFGRSALVVVQVAGSVVLLVASTQLFRGFSFLLSHNPGFRTDHLLISSFDPSLLRYTPEKTEQFYKTLEDRVRAMAGVRRVALSYSIPLGAVQNQEALIPLGYRLPTGQQSIQVSCNIVDSDYFSTFGVPMLRGRGFRPTDRADTPRVIVVNRAFARRYLGSNPIGRRIRLNGPQGPLAEVVGVTVTGKYFSLFEPEMDYAYLPLSQNPMPQLTLIAATSGDPAALAAPLRAVAHSIDPDVPVFGQRTMADFFDQRSVHVAHILNELVTMVGLIGLALALVGLYAVVAYQVNRRTREIGIRMAIGADRRHVMRMVLKQAAAMALTGVVLGAALSLAGGRALSTGLGIPAFDPLFFTLVPLVLIVTTMLAAAIPARRATRIDPMLALRQD
jgi:putative ABC transport system permease protein